MIALKTERLLLREACADDSEFILKLLNEPAWHKFIFNHSINTFEKASEYIDQKLIAMYKQNGFGLWVMETIEDAAKIGICGLIRRDTLPHIDLGFAVLSEYRRQGYTSEAALACLAYAKDQLNAHKVLAIVNPSNVPSTQMLKNLGFTFESEFSHPNSDEVFSLYSRTQ